MKLSQHDEAGIEPISAVDDQVPGRGSVHVQTEVLKELTTGRSRLCLLGRRIRRSAAGDDRAGLYPPGHVVGNWLFNRLFRALFGATFTDVFSGYRVLSRRFVKSFPVRFPGFEIETELAAHAVDIGLPYAETMTTYRARPSGSTSKLRTVRDGARIFLAGVLLFKEMRPARFFGLITVALTAIALALGVPVIQEFLRTGLVPRLPTAVLSASIQIVAFICLTAGLVLDSVCRSRREARRLAYLSMSAVGAVEFAAASPSGVAHRGPRSEVPESSGPGVARPSAPPVRPTRIDPGPG